MLGRQGGATPAAFCLLSTIALLALCAPGAAAPSTDDAPWEGVSAVALGYELDIRPKGEAPSLQGGRGWLNVSRPLTLKDLRGKVVLLDFWTFCCINCMHVISDLKRLERKYPHELAVIGVHSAKFYNEKMTENIRSAVLRYEIEHPVVNDADFVIWRRYGARAWPTLVLIDPQGQVVATLSGEGHYDALDRAIARLIDQHAGALNPDPLPLDLERDKAAGTVLSFPGKVLADQEGRRLFVADTNHNRIVIADLTGKVLFVAGSGEVGFTDGSFGQATFNHPQGMTRHGKWLYVADTENHALRRLDLETQRVETVAGTGTQSHARRGGPARQTRLNSPWDLERIGDAIYIANAGSHQLWVYRPSANVVEPFVGSGREDIIDGPAGASALAQPSGLTTDGVHLYFADSEVSALRKVDMSGKAPTVRSLLGTGLFDFGDRDGAWETARLQHPLGVAYADGKVYVADSYNHKIKVADLKAGTISTLAGTGIAGSGAEEAPQFNEPGGLSAAGDKIYVADTNNHSVRVLDLKTGRVRRLTFDFSSVAGSSGPASFEVFGEPALVNLHGQQIFLGGSVEIGLEFPQGYQLTPGAPPTVQFRVTSPEGQEWIGNPFVPEATADTIRFDLTDIAPSRPERIEIALTFYYCEEDKQGQCYIGSALMKGPLAVGRQTTRLHLPVQVPAP